ncbi:hypothetical protein FO519_000748 [Halicephalobus sp. NKZ332]|nr:hypothetical protein FO519_000748 [Halicephalobus sp. NKZ332]
MFLSTHHLYFACILILTKTVVNAFEGSLPHAGGGASFQKHLTILKGIARLQSPDGEVRGVVEFIQHFRAGAPTVIHGIFRGLPNEDEFGLKIVEYGNMTNGCISMGKEFNPDGLRRRAEANHSGHWVGTLGNVKNGKYESHHNHKVSLFGRNSVIGRGIVLFENRDDGGEFSTRESQRSGSVGRPVACGIIGRLGSNF